MHDPTAPAAAPVCGPAPVPTLLPFSPSAPFTMGIELELQLVNRRNYNLATDAVDLWGLIEPRSLQPQIKLEITQGMIELNSGVHTRIDQLGEELKELRRALVDGAMRLNIDVAGGGAHPFQRWSEQRISPDERFHYLHKKYGYLAKSFTVFKNVTSAAYGLHGSMLLRVNMA